MLVCTLVQTATSRYLSLSRGVLIHFHRDSSLLRGSQGRSRAAHSSESVALSLQNVPRPAAHRNYSLFIKAKVPLPRHFCKYISPNRSCRKEKWRWYRFSAARSIAEQPPSGFRAFGCGHRVRVCRRVRLSCFRQSGACRHHRGGA